MLPSQNEVVVLCAEATEGATAYVCPRICLLQVGLKTPPPPRMVLPGILKTAVPCSLLWLPSMSGSGLRAPRFEMGLIPPPHQRMLGERKPEKGCKRWVPNDTCRSGCRGSSLVSLVCVLSPSRSQKGSLLRAGCVLVASCAACFLAHASSGLAWPWVWPWPLQTGVRLLLPRADASTAGAGAPSAAVSMAVAGIWQPSRCTV